MVKKIKYQSDEKNLQIETTKKLYGESKGVQRGVST